MRYRVARVLLVVITFVVLAVGQSGCGGNSSSPTAPSMAPGPTPPPTPNY